MRVIFVGSNPSAASLKQIAFDRSTKSGLTLRKWAQEVGVEEAYYINVANKPTPNNRPLKKSEICNRLDAVQEEISWYQGMNTEKLHIVAVGKTAETALTLLHQLFYSMPHPSGLNRKLNDPAYVAEKINGLKNFLSPSKIE